MDFRILGPLQALDKGRVVTPRGDKQRALLALLLLHPNEPLSNDRLIDLIWGGRPPTTGAKTVQMHVSRLRRTLAGAADNGSNGLIVTHDHGYELRLEPDDIDAHRFEVLLAKARHELAEGHAERAAYTLERALSLWRGHPLGDLAYEPFAEREIARLDDLRLAAQEVQIEARLELGQHDRVIAELEAMIREHPYRERLHAHLMLALYRCDRQADALQAYHDARHTLVEQLGIEPGERLRELQHAILAQDPDLVVPAGRDHAELPPGLDTSTMLVGRTAELDRLRDQWRRAELGAGGLMLVAGPDGIGKTRLSAELARELESGGHRVRYLSGAEGAEEAQATLMGMRAVRRPTLLVVDDLDDTQAERLTALRELAAVLPGLPVLVLAAGRDSELAAWLELDATVELGPLDVDGVLAIARLYAGGREDAAIPVGQLVAESAGVPRGAHRAAARWARARAARRLSVVAERAALERADLRLAEDDLAGSVAELQAVQERTEPDWAGRGDLICPFKGLAMFDVHDGEVFFGRERLVAEMVARLSGAPLMGIVGPSGSGKSSVLRAGLLASLADGVLPGSENWPIALLRPGEHPLRALDAATAVASPGVDLIVAVDQFEESFTACRDDAERSEFIHALISFARGSGRRALVLIAVRADFYGRCAAHSELSRLLGANHVLVGPMRRGELRRAIELPARHTGVQVEPALVDALIADVEGEPGALPLLSSSLLELWQRRDGRHLRRGDYESTGGVHGAVARLAEGAYEGLGPDRRRLARRILVRLAGEGQGAEVVRRRVRLSELDGDRDRRVPEVLGALADARLVTIGEGEVEVAHEALLREWPRLRGWLEEDADGRRLHRRLAAAASEWRAGGREDEELYRGARLASALEWAAGHRGELNVTERAFLDASRAAGERSERRLRVLVSAVAALFLLAVIASIVALAERGNARHEAVAADAQRLGAQALVEDDLDHSLLLARQGVALDDTVQTRGNLLAGLLESPAAIGVLRGDGDRLIGLDLSPDGRTLALLENDGRLTFFDTRARQPAGRATTVRGLAGVIVDAELRPDVRFSPDGSRVAVGGGEPAILDARSHRVLSSLRIGRGRVMYAMRFSPTGRRLMAALALPTERGTVVRAFDVASGRPLGRGRQVSAGLTTLMLTSDGRRAITATPGEPTLISDALTLRPLRRLRVRAEHATLSPDDRTMLVGGRDGSVRFLQLDSGVLRRAAGRHAGAVVESMFSANGRTAITAGEDGRLIVWDVPRAAAGETLEGHAGQITGLATTGDGATLYTTGLDGKALIWDLGGSRRLGRPFRGGAEIPGLPRYAISPDGRMLALGQADGTVVLVDPRTLRRTGRFRAVPDGPVAGMGFAPRGGLLVVGGEDGSLALVDPGGRRVVARVRGHRDAVSTPSFSSDGRLMATSSDRRGAANDGVVRLWKLPSGEPAGPPLRLPTVGDASLSPDGRKLAVTRPPTGRVEIFDLAERERTATLVGSETVWDLARFTADGRHVVGGSYKGWARLWSVEVPRPNNLAQEWPPATRRFVGHAGGVVGQSLSPDGRILATGSPDGTVRLWDLPTQHALGGALSGVPSRAVVPQFTPDGDYLFAIHNSGLVYRWDVRPASWARQACTVAGRRLSRTEWADALPDRDYDPAC